jgi:hypothetical protein
MKQLIFLLEEPSAKEMLKGILPGILPDHLHPVFRVFEGKQDLEKSLPRILKAWRAPDCSFVVLRDQDSGNCHDVKNKLTDLCRQAGKDNVLVRVACHELESFYLGDLVAVEKGLGLSGIAKMQKKNKYRDPDRLTNPSQELENLSSGNYQKVSGSRAIAPYLHFDGNKSHSFGVLLSGIVKFVNSQN